MAFTAIGLMIMLLLVVSTSSIRRIIAGCAWAGRIAAFGAGQAGAGDLPGVFRRLAGAGDQYPLHAAARGALAVGCVILVVAVADLGTAVVLGVTAAVVFFVAGPGDGGTARLRLALASLAVVVFICSQPYRLKRVLGFIDPELQVSSSSCRRTARSGATCNVADHARHQLSGASCRRSPSAPAALAGLGLGQGRQKLLYLPEAHTDFILAIDRRGDSGWSARWWCWSASWSSSGAACGPRCWRPTNSDDIWRWASPPSWWCRG